MAYANALTAEQLSFYAIQLQDLNCESVSAAVNSLIHKSRFVPTIAEIRAECAMVSDVVNQREKAASAAEAWQKTIQAIQMYGHDRGRDHLDEVTRKVANRFGWRDLCYGDIKDEPIRRAQFMRIYDAVVVERQNTDNVMRQVKVNPELHDAYRAKVAELADMKKLEGGND